MTDEERKQFESNQLHHADQEPDPSGPASETEQATERVRPQMPPVLPNPD
jgi:hypothetical protein